MSGEGKEEVGKIGEGRAAEVEPQVILGVGDSVLTGTRMRTSRCMCGRGTVGQDNEEAPGWERPRRPFLEAQVAKSVSKPPSLPFPTTPLKRTQRRKHSPLSDTILR